MELRDTLKNIYKNLEKYSFSKEQEKALYDYGKMLSENDSASFFAESAGKQPGADNCTAVVVQTESAD